MGSLIVFMVYFRRYLQDYFKPGMEMLQRDAGMLNALLKKTSPAVYRHLQKHKVEPLLFMTDWFLCAMTRTLPWDTLLRVWDCFLCEGIKVLFKVRAKWGDNFHWNLNYSNVPCRLRW